VIPLQFHRKLHAATASSPASFGYDVEATKRAVYRLLNNGPKWTGFIAQSPKAKKTFGKVFAKDLTLAQRQLTAGRTEGVLDESTLRALEDAGAFDGQARALWILQYAPPPLPALIEPKQGFGSLDRSLWRAYTMGREKKLVDEGTYNPRSILPRSGKPSDHATSRLDGKIEPPAVAFDMGFTPATGYNHPVARSFFEEMIGRPEVNYVILGTKIWSVERGLHDYTSGGHESHVHTSGFRH